MPARKTRHFKDAAAPHFAKSTAAKSTPAGLTAAQEMLRHADVTVTAAHYVENKQPSFSASDIF
jgi:hypothetical protein